MEPFWSITAIGLTHAFIHRINIVKHYKRFSVRFSVISFPGLLGDILDRRRILGISRYSRRLMVLGLFVPTITVVFRLRPILDESNSSDTENRQFALIG